MSATSVKLLLAAAQMLGSTTELARRLEIGEKLLAVYMADVRELPDSLLLRVVDIVLADRLPFGAGAPAQPLTGEVQQRKELGSRD
jgi:hypothetical protein